MTYVYNMLILVVINIEWPLLIQIQKYTLLPNRSMFRRMGNRLLIKFKINQPIDVSLKPITFSKVFNGLVFNELNISASDHLLEFML